MIPLIPPRCPYFPYYSYYNTSSEPLNNVCPIYPFPSYFFVFSKDQFSPITMTLFLSL